MPKAKTVTRAGQQAEALLVLKCGTKGVIVPRPKTHKAAIDVARRHFPSIKEQNMILQTDQLAICNNNLMDIAPESWETVVDLVSTIIVVERHECTQAIPVAPVPAPKVNDLPIGPGSDRQGKIKVHFSFKDLSFSVRMQNDMKFQKIRHLIERIFGCDCDHMSMVHDGARFGFKDTPSSCWMEDGALVDIFQHQDGGKLVIYLYSPTETEVSVALTLTRDWSFSAIYPVVPAKSPHSGAGQRIQWNVRTHLDGSLTELNTGLDVAYLFWEAHTNPGIPPSPPASPVVHQFTAAESFSPLTSDLSPTDSVVVAVTEITPYLDKVLLALGLHTEARTSFITYWLPSFLKHTHIAVRFVPQAAYETAASLDIIPTPDVVTCVFMLFKGIEDEALNDWADAQHGENDPQRWKDVVGVDVERASDAALFRVLEWGGMEVLL
ncbi:hypothetical protein B0H13DRAFT_2276648 [Mycena leptocephala]|nr:hypothetical protein B0H13DRAFT_2276648 [Mycena leptocephala]